MKKKKLFKARKLIFKKLNNLLHKLIILHCKILIYFLTDYFYQIKLMMNQSLKLLNKFKIKLINQKSKLFFVFFIFVKNFFLISSKKVTIQNLKILVD